MHIENKDGSTIIDTDDDEPSSAANDKAQDLNDSAAEVSSARPSSFTPATNDEIHRAQAEEHADVALSAAADANFTGRVIESRYVLRQRIGHGAQGNVWIAHDPIMREQVAFKWMRSTHDVRRAGVRREIAMLRMLRAPGVVRFLDEGIADGKPYIVMEYFPGRPFPGVDDGAPWQTIADTTLALLETLSHVHAAGVVHRDLKPDNVLVNNEGRPGIVDFGISHLRDPNLGPFAAKGIIGTPLYLAPEQILGREVDARTDLFALGLMLYKALTGRVPHDHPDRKTLEDLRLNTPVPSIEQHVPTLPAHVVAVIHRLLALRREERFASAAEVIAALRGDSQPSRFSSALLEMHGPSSGPIPESDLVKCFDGPNRLLHLPEDAARILHQRTGGDPEAIELELEQWVRQGLASRKGTLFAVHRTSLDWLAAGPSGPAEERHLRALVNSEDIADATRHTIILATEYARSGKLAAAMRVLGDALRLVRAHGAAPQEIAILTMLAKVALAEDIPRAFDHVLYELARTNQTHPAVEQLGTLMRAGQKASGARHDQTLDALNNLGPLDDPELERARHRMLITAVASRASAPLIAKMLADVQTWRQRSGHVLAELTLLEGQARQRYHEGLFEEAARLCLQAASLEDWATSRVDLMLRSASASLEAFRHEDAAATAETARSLAMQSRHPYWEGRAEWVLRSVAYRSGKTTGPDMELIAAVERVGVDNLEALVCVNEAAVAMRVNQHELARTLADRAAAIWRGMERPLADMFARSLAIACGAPSTEVEAETLATQARTCRVPGLGIQALGLLGRAFPTMRSSWQRDIEHLAHQVPQQHWHERMDILSIAEALSGVW